MAYGDRLFIHYHLWRCTCHCLGETSRYISPHLINMSRATAVCKSQCWDWREKYLHCVQETTFKWWIVATLRSMALPAEHTVSRLLSLSPCYCGNENCGTIRSLGPLRPGAGIFCKLSGAVRGNSDWWKIRKTDCMGWWTAVSQINLAISDPAELTIVSAERLLFQTLVVILPPSRVLVRCQLRAETPSALPCKQRYVWNDVKISRPNNKIEISRNNTKVCSVLWICLQNHRISSKAQLCRDMLY